MLKFELPTMFISPIALTLLAGGLLLLAGEWWLRCRYFRDRSKYKELGWHADPSLDFPDGH